MTQTNMQQHSEPMAVHHHRVAWQWLAQRSSCWDRIFKSGLKPASCRIGRGLLPVMNSHVAPLSEPTHDPNKHTRSLRTNSSPSSRSGAAIACPEELWMGSNLQILPLKAESVKSGRRLLTVMNSHVAPLSEPTHDPNKHATVLRANDSPPSRSGVAIACQEELWLGSNFQISPQT